MNVEFHRYQFNASQKLKPWIAEPTPLGLRLRRSAVKAMSQSILPALKQQRRGLHRILSRPPLFVVLPQPDSTLAQPEIDFDHQVQTLIHEIDHLAKKFQ